NTIVHTATLGDSSGAFVGPCCLVKGELDENIHPNSLIPPIMRQNTPIQGSEIKSLAFQNSQNGIKSDMEGRVTSTVALFSSIQSGDTARVELILDQGVDIESEDFRCRRALHKAVEYGTDSIAALLLAK